MKISKFEEIEAWQSARQLTLKVYQASIKGSFSRDWSLKDQINRAAGSSMDNIAEGFDGGSNAEFIRFLGYAQRSCSEVQSQLYRALDRQHIIEEEFNSLYELAGKTKAGIGGFIKYLKDYKRQKC